MPRPTAAQLAYGTATVVFSTMAMLLLSQTRSVVGVASIAVAGLALGLFVAVTVPASRATAVRPGGAVRGAGAGTRSGTGGARTTRVISSEELAAHRSARPRARAGAGAASSSGSGSGSSGSMRR